MNDDGPGIAIIGMSGRFPGAPDIATFWANLCAGVESITHFGPDELADAFGPDVRAQPNYVAARSVLPDVDLFDAPFFGMHAREAALTDPQHRIFLECAWEALEDAAYDPGAYPGTIGIVAGSSITSYFLRNVLGDREAIDTFTSEYGVDSYPQLLGSGYDFLATRVAYKLNLRGPALTVQSACSTSLTAVAQACGMLLLGQADMMLAGGVSITFPQERGYVHQPGGMVSADGHCRTFDAAASGTVFGAGAGTVVLKRLADALADGDRIYAVIRGLGINNDGSAKAGYTAPSSSGQAAAIRAAHAMAHFNPQTIRYVECHGTATPLGDPIEFAALAKVFPAQADGTAYCALGSVKANVGHLDIAAGMSGLIKTALCVERGKLPPLLHFTKINPRIPLNGSPFYINAELHDWPAGDIRRRAGVSAFGVGGTNVHLALEAAPAHAVPAERSCDDAQLLVLSARSAAALEAARLRLAAYLRANPAVALRDVAYTLQSGRRAFAYRAAITARSVPDALVKLDAPVQIEAPAAATAPGVTFLFPGQGVQYPDMGRGLYDRFPVFRAALDACAASLEPLMGYDIRDAIYPSDNDGTAAQDLTATQLAQPAIFAVEYALARLWQSFGVTPAAMAGHSVGEFVAATLAGVFSLDAAVALVAERGRLMQTMPGGAMLAVRLKPIDLQPLIAPPVGLAAVNSKSLCVAAGPFDAIEKLEATLRDHGVVFRRLETSHAFHSPMMEPIVAPLSERIATMPLRAPALPYVSSLTGDWITADEATSPVYWARHCRDAVQFAGALETLQAAGHTTLLEVGPGAVLSTFARQTFGAGATTIESLSGALRERDDSEALLDAVGRLWVAGVPISWRALHHRQTPRRLSLPTYPFERARYWLDEPARQTAAAPAARVPAPLLAITITENGPLASTASAPATDTAQETNVRRDLMRLLEELSGETLATADCERSFLELGFDSLFLGRFVSRLGAQFDVELTFRQLLNDLPTIAAVAAKISQLHPRDANESLTATHIDAPPSVAPQVAAAQAAAAIAARPAVAGSVIESIVRDQLAAMHALMREQLAALGTSSSAATAALPAPSNVDVASVTTLSPHAASVQKAEPAPAPQTAAPAASPSRFEVFRPGSTGPRADLTPAQRAHIDDVIARTVARTPHSKAFTQRHRAVLADPRVAAGFRSEWKEMVYPIVCDRAKGSKLWDIDGNRYIDVLNGFGQTAFGHSPHFVVDAIEGQLKRGFPIGPQTSLAGEVAELFCELTGNERVTFCNTGSEAVMAALRLARTVTGRDRVVVFNGAYHGQFDEVLVKGARASQRALPVAPGIPGESVANMIVLPYADNASLAWVREHAKELAAVVVEPVQSRHPDLQPQEFLHEIRAITHASGTAFVFDEVVTGFRMHTAGLQEVFGIRADLATYGKVVGGGMPIGILAGTARFMDALDGGMWQYGDDSVPEVAPTFFAGTFVRHPLVMSAVLSVLQHLKEKGPQLQATLSARTAELIARLNADLVRRGIISRIETYGSLFYVNFSAEERLAGLLYYHLRLRGIYIQEGFPCFLTSAHSPADIEAIVTAFKDSFDELQAVGIFASSAVTAAVYDGDSTQPATGHDVALTEEQTEIWLAAQLSDAASCAFNESVTLRLDGTLDESAFAFAWDASIARHPALRAVFSPTGETFRIAAAAGLPYAYSDLSHLRSEDAERELAAAIARDAATPFDLVAGPPVRGHLVRLTSATHAFVFTAHHIICDGWSINVLLEEFAVQYSAALRSEPPHLVPALSFADYARSRDQRDPAGVATTQAFWLAQFAEPVRPLELPADRPRPALRTFAGATRSTHIDAERYRTIKKAGASHGCTLFVTLLAAFSTLVGRLARTTDVVVGVPAAGQALLGGEVLVGHCVDLLPIRHRAVDTASLADQLSALKTRVLDAYEHQDFTLGTLVRKLELPRATNRLPLAEIQFNLERLGDAPSVPDLRARVEPNAKAFVNFDLFLNIIESDDGLRVDCDYNTDLFDGATIDRWLVAYGIVLDAIAAQPATRVCDVAIGDSEPQALSIAEATATASPLDATVDSLCEGQAHLRPDAIAAICGDERLTYSALEQRVTALAVHLQTRVEGSSRRRIAVAVPRSLDMLVALLATLKAGHTYVPLDPTHPPARLRHILADARVGGLITSGPTDIEAPAGVPVIHLELDRAAIERANAALAPRATTLDDIAYAIYTSGSTGTPKGVEITHGALVNFITSMLREPGFCADDTLLAVTTVAFDIAALELFVPLVAGGTVAIARSEETRDGFLLLQRLHATRATVMQATPATWRLLLEAGFAAERGFTMLCGGEALRRDLADRLLGGKGALWNMYGPTETTIWSACAQVRAGETIVAGGPIANTQFYILDDSDRPLPLGSPGQLHIGGAGVARGYIDRTELTAEKFIANPFGPGRIYRTGDLARMNGAGEVEIVGRLDDQIKIRGYRIEPGEIEIILVRHGGVAAAAVALRDDVAGGARLVAYYVERSGTPVTPDMLRAAAGAHLPDYMVPSVWMALAALPLNPNGKLDRGALPAPPAEADAGAADFAAPQTATEIALAAIWASVLGRERISTDDDIFALGADSIQIFQITARANRQGVPVLAKHLMQHRTLGRTAQHIDCSKSAPFSAPHSPKRRLLTDVARTSVPQHDR